MQILDLVNYFKIDCIKNRFILVFKDKKIGYVKSDIVDFLVSIYSNNFYIQDNLLHFKVLDDSFLSCSNLFNQIADSFLKYEIIPFLRNEYILVKDFSLQESCFKVDRAIGHLFGFIAQGIHVNAFVKKDNERHIWISKRGNTIVEPFKFDSTVGGAISHPYTAFETVVKETQEEAGILEMYSKNAIYERTLSYIVERYNGTRNDIMHIYSLELPYNIIPAPLDKEALAFFLMTEEEALVHILDNLDEYKYNSLLAIFSFFQTCNSYLLNKYKLKDIADLITNLSYDFNIKNLDNKDFYK